MSIHSQNTSKFTKHIGTYGDKRIVVVIQVPEDPHVVHIIDTEALPDNYHQNIMDILESPEAQNARWFGEVLSRRMFFDGTNALRSCYERQWIQFVPTNAVYLTPSANHRKLLSESLGQLSQQYAPVDPLAALQNPASVQDQQYNDLARQEQAKMDALNTPTDTHNQHIQNLQGDVTEHNKMVAANLIVEARLLEADAKAKRDTAAQYDPSLVIQSVPTQPVMMSPTVENKTFVDSVTGRSYKSASALKGAITRREKAAN